MNRTDLDHRLTRLREPLVVPAVPSVSAQPGESSFHHPAPRQLHVSDTPGRTTDDLDHIPSPGLHQPALEVAIVVLPVSPNLLQTGLMLGGQLAQHLRGNRTIVGRGHRHQYAFMGWDPLFSRVSQKSDSRKTGGLRLSDTREPLVFSHPGL